MRKTSDDVSMLSGPIGKSLLSFALPLLLGTVFQPLYNMADSFVVGNVLGEAALAAVSSASSLINLLVDMFVGLFTGAGGIWGAILFPCPCRTWAVPRQTDPPCRSS